MKDKYYVYYHKNPKTLKIFYVGLGYDRRAWNLKGRNRYWNNYVNKHGNPIIELVKENLTRQEAAKLEINLIELLGRRIKKTGDLVNICDGGEGSGGYTHTEEWKQNQSINQTGKKLGPLSEKARKKISESLKGRERPTQMKPVLQYNLQGKFIKRYKSEKEARLTTGIRSIFENATGYKNNKVKTAGGYIWIYENEFTEKKLIKKLKIANSPKSPTPKRARKNISKNLGKPILQYTLHGEFIKEWPSTKTANKYYKTSSIGNCCRKSQKTSCGYNWKFKNE